MTSKFIESWHEKEPTCPGGWFMRWTVEVEEPNIEIGSSHAMIHIVEGSTNPENGKDELLLDLADAEKLREILTRAIEYGHVAEQAAIKANERSDEP